MSEKDFVVIVVAVQHYTSTRLTKMSKNGKWLKGYTINYDLTFVSSLIFVVLTLIIYSTLLCWCRSITDSTQIRGFTWKKRNEAKWVTYTYN